MTPDHRQLNLEILELIVKEKRRWHDEYVGAVAYAAGQKASHEAFESHRDPDDGVGGFMQGNPYDYKRAEQNRDENESKYRRMEEIYNHAIHVFIV